MNQPTEQGVLYRDAVELLSRLIATPSVSRDEAATAGVIESFLTDRGVQTRRKGNNIWAFNRHFSDLKPTILLNSHHDTVRPVSGYTRAPFDPSVVEGRLYGLGSNDAGASVVSLTAAFLRFYDRADMRYNLCLAITAEEEVSGAGGIESILPELGNLDFAIVGEPTGMHLAVAERGLMVLDCTARGKAGHAARDEGDNAIYRAMTDIEWFRTYRFPKVSDVLGGVKMNVTMIAAGTQHNAIPDRCDFTVDVRVNDLYTNEEVLAVVRGNIGCEVTPRSTRLRSSSIPQDHPVVRAGAALGREVFGSPTLSDQALLGIPSLKMGPGESARSHMADEYVLLSEIEEGIELYIRILDSIL